MYLPFSPHYVPAKTRLHQGFNDNIPERLTLIREPMNLSPYPEIRDYQHDTIYEMLPPLIFIDFIIM